jgi:hypothetical protein
MDKPPAHAIDEKTGEPLYNFRQVGKICGVDPASVRNWVLGATPFVEFDFDVKRMPVTHHRRSTQTPRSFRHTRLLIPENRVDALKQMLEECPRRHGPLSREDMHTLEAAARRFRLSLSHKEHSLSL